MKKKLLFVITTLLLLTLVACGAKETVAEVKETQTESSDAEESNQIPDETEEETSEVIAEVEEVEEDETEEIEEVPVSSDEEADVIDMSIMTDYEVGDNILVEDNWDGTSLYAMEFLPRIYLPREEYITSGDYDEGHQTYVYNININENLVMSCWGEVDSRNLDCEGKDYDHYSSEEIGNYTLDVNIHDGSTAINIVNHSNNDESIRITFMAYYKGTDREGYSESWKEFSIANAEYIAEQLRKFQGITE